MVTVATMQMLWPVLLFVSDVPVWISLAGAVVALGIVVLLIAVMTKVVLIPSGTAT